MTNIYFSLFNHYPSVHETLLDLLRPFAAAFTDLGHVVGIGKTTMAKDSLNIVTEFFDRDCDDILLNSGVRFALIQTEMMTGDTFNNDDIFKQRYKRFMRVAKKAEFVINIVGETTVPCPSFKCEPGYHPSLVIPDNFMPEADFCFFGTRSHRREEMMKMICNRGFQIYVCDQMDFESRNNAVQRSRYVLGLRAHWPMECVSLTRISAALHCGRPVLHEKVPVTGLMSNVPLIHADNGEFDEWCANIANKRELWREMKFMQGEIFRKNPVTDMMAETMKAANVKI